LRPFAVNSSTTSVSGSYGTALRTEAIFDVIPCVARSGHFANSERCTRFFVSPRTASGLSAVSMSSTDDPSRPIVRSRTDCSPNCKYLRPFSENDLPMMSGFTLKPSPISCSDGRCECIRRAISKIAPAAFTRCATTTAF
jgi:hypothetical protein